MRSPHGDVGSPGAGFCGLVPAFGGSRGRGSRLLHPQILPQGKLLPSLWRWCLPILPLATVYFGLENGSILVIKDLPDLILFPGLKISRSVKRMRKRALCGGGPRPAHFEKGFGVPLGSPFIISF